MRLPNDTVEKVIANRFLRRPEYHPVLAQFFDKRHYDSKSIGAMMGIMVEYYRKYSKVPSDDLIRRIIPAAAEGMKLDAKKLQLEFDSIADLDLREDEEYVKQNVVDFVKAKSIYFAIMDNLDKIEKDRDVNDIRDKLDKLESVSFDQCLGMNYFQDIDKHWDSVENPEAKVSTGFDQLDRVTNGGIPTAGKCLVCFMAQAGLGKSLMLSNLAVNFLKQNLSVVIVSLEMCEDVYAQRMDAHLTSCDINQLRFNRGESVKKIQDFRKLYPKSNLLIKEYPPESINSNVIKAYIEKVKRAGYPVDVIIVDYINLLLSNTKQSKDGGMYERVGSVARELRALSYTFNCPVCSVTQCNRCLTLDTEVKILKSGQEKQIKIADISEGDLIKGSTGFNMVLKKHAVVKQKVFKITTKSGLVIKCSDRHEFPCSCDVTSVASEKSILTGLKVGDTLTVEPFWHNQIERS